MVWFLAPTAILCAQQFLLLKYELTAVQIKLLQGSDGVDKWKSEKVWDDALRNIRVVVSTPQILLDGLTHKFIQISALSLLIFDEGMSWCAPFIRFK